MRHLNDSLYKRIRTIIENSSKRFFVLCNEHHRSTYIDREPNESCNDRNDRAIRVATSWYEEHLRHLDIDVVLLTNDKENRDKATKAGLKSYQVCNVVVCELEFRMVAFLAKTGIYCFSDTYCESLSS